MVLAMSMTAAGHSGHTLTPTEIGAVIQAVEDEIYREGDYSEFYQIGHNLGTPQHWKSRLHIYTNPEYGGEFEGNEEVGEVIYKFMPYGEVVRLFVIQKGQVLLIGDPENGFPITQPSHLAVLDDDEEICRLKRIWLQRSLIVDTSPTQEMLQNSDRRQQIRRRIQAGK